MTEVRTWRKDGVTLYHADCRALLPWLRRDGITTILTDPPHRGTDYTDRRELGLEVDLPGELLAWQADQLMWTRQWLPAMLRLIKPSALAWVFCSPIHLPVFAHVVYDVPWPLRRIWTRPECFALLLLTERILAREACEELAWRILRAPYEPPAQALAILNLLLSLCGPDEVILDPFAGASAGFLIVARRRGLRAVGIEHDAQAFDAAVAALEA